MLYYLCKRFGQTVSKEPFVNIPALKTLIKNSFICSTIKNVFIYRDIYFLIDNKKINSEILCNQCNKKIKNGSSIEQTKSEFLPKQAIVIHDTWSDKNSRSSEECNKFDQHVRVSQLDHGIFFHSKDKSHHQALNKGKAIFVIPVCSENKSLSGGNDYLQNILYPVLKAKKDFSIKLIGSIQAETFTLMAVKNKNGGYKENSEKAKKIIDDTIKNVRNELKNVPISVDINFEIERFPQVFAFLISVYLLGQHKNVKNRKINIESVLPKKLQKDHNIPGNISKLINQFISNNPKENAYKKSCSNFYKTVSGLEERYKSDKSRDPLFVRIVTLIEISTFLTLKNPLRDGITLIASPMLDDRSSMEIKKACKIILQLLQVRAKKDGPYKYWANKPSLRNKISHVMHADVRKRKNINWSCDRRFEMILEMMKFFELELKMLKEDKEKISLKLLESQIQNNFKGPILTV